MEAFTRGARFHYFAGLAAERGGDKALAADHWRRATADSNGPQIAFAREAARRLPDYDDRQWQERLESRVASAPSVWRGTVLRSLGRPADARRAFQEALLAADRGLSRYVARTELAELDSVH
jgi:hypothetical protein